MIRIRKRDLQAPVLRRICPRGTPAAARQNAAMWYAARMSSDTEKTKRSHVFCVDGDGIFEGDVEVDGSLSVGGELNVRGDVKIDGTLIVNGERLGKRPPHKSG